MLAISELIAFFKFLFFIIETTYLKIFGILSTPLFISFFPREEFIAFDPISRPILAKFPASPLSDYFLASL